MLVIYSVCQSFSYLPFLIAEDWETQAGIWLWKWTIQKTQRGNSLRNKMFTYVFIAHYTVPFDANVNMMISDSS